MDTWENRNVEICNIVILTGSYTYNKTSIKQAKIKKKKNMWPNTYTYAHKHYYFSGSL